MLSLLAMYVLGTFLTSLTVSVTLICQGALRRSKTGLHSDRVFDCHNLFLLDLLFLRVHCSTCRILILFIIEF